MNCSMQQFREQLVLSIGTKLAVFVYHSQVLSGAGHRQKLRKFIEILETFGGKAMWQRNNGQAEDDLQFRFTAYLVSAVKRRRKDYLIQLYKRSSIESTVEVVYESEPSSEEVVLDKLPLMDVIENGALLEALQKLNERERQIFLARTLEEEDFETLGVKFELSYKGAAALYYRTIQKIRKSIEGGDKR
ncbi:sigma-70 family RNA polymerase sigma factor [Coprococcus catus]|nr:sigma-70 family RNA polymerase sigma factor [Coprococcus catus]MCO7144816.1 sigma-70 family RNA polymerase sigma factor [Coprococcus catus]